MGWKILFKIYNFYFKLCSFLKIKYYKTIWKDNLNLKQDFDFSLDSHIDIQSGNANVIIGNNVKFRRFCSIICSDYGRLKIGNNVFFNNYSSINCLSEIIIGDNSIFGEGVRIYDHNHNFRENDLIRNQGHSYGSIKIGNNCWIGSNTIILPNVEIGNNVVIGANNLIYKSLSNNSVVKAKVEIIVDDIRFNN